MVFCSFPIPAIPPSHIKAHHIRGAWTTADPTQCEQMFLSILKQRGSIAEGTLSGYQRLLAVAGREGFTRTECDWARTNATLAPIKRAASRGIHLGEFARPECERACTNATSAPRMRAGSHGRNLGEFKRSECERARTDAISQNASELAQTPPGRVHAPRMRAGTHKRHLSHLRSSRRERRRAD